MPLSQDAKRNIRELMNEHPDWPHDRVIAAGLEAARQAGNASIRPPSTTKARRKKTYITRKGSK